MGLDIRWPIGLMFTLVGALLVIYGLATLSDAEVYRRSMDNYIHLLCGLVLMVFGGSLLTLAWRASRQPAEPQGSEKK